MGKKKVTKGVNSPFHFDREATSPEDINYITSSQLERKIFLQVDFGVQVLKDDFKEHCEYMKCSMNERIRFLVRKDISWHRRKRIRDMKDAKKW